MIICCELQKTSVERTIDNMSEKIDDLYNSKREFSQICMVTKLPETVETKDKQIKALKDRLKQLKQYLRN